jgi:hypothetical protein
MRGTCQYMKIAEHSPLDQMDSAVNLGAVPRALPEILTLEVKNRTNIFGVRVGLLINPASKSYRLPPSTFVTGIGRVGSVKAMSPLGESLTDLTFRTLRTGISMSRAYAREDNIKTFKDLKKGVLSVLEGEGGLPLWAHSDAPAQLPPETSPCCHVDRWSPVDIGANTSAPAPSDLAAAVGSSFG